MPQPQPDLGSGANRGLYRKYQVERVDRSTRHAGCPYYVFDVAHDSRSWEALLVYADAVRTELPLLADDLERLVHQYEPREAEVARYGIGIEVENLTHEVEALRKERHEVRQQLDTLKQENELLQRMLDEVREEGACRLQQQHTDMRTADRLEL